MIPFLRISFELVDAATGECKTTCILLKPKQNLTSYFINSINSYIYRFFDNRIDVDLVTPRPIIELITDPQLFFNKMDVHCTQIGLANPYTLKLFINLLNTLNK